MPGHQEQQEKALIAGRQRCYSHGDPCKDLPMNEFWVGVGGTQRQKAAEGTSNPYPPQCHPLGEARVAAPLPKTLAAAGSPEGAPWGELRGAMPGALREALRRTPRGALRE